MTPSPPPPHISRNLGGGPKYRIYCHYSCHDCQYDNHDDDDDDDIYDVVDELWE